MATIIINSQGNASYGGGQGIADVFDFNTTGPTRLVVADNFIRQWTPGILSLALLGSSHADTVSIQMTGNRLDARDVTFGGGWSGRRDTLEISDTGLNSTIFGSGLRDRIEVTGGEDTVRGGEGTDTLVLSYGLRSEDFYMPADDRILGGGDTSVRLSGIEKLDATLGSGDDVLRGLDGSDVLRGGSGSDELKGRDGHDSLVGGEGDDFLRGGRGDDVLNGAKGADAMTGGTGNDTYYVDDPLDRITELLGEGADTVRSRVTIELAGSQVENVVLVGSGDISVSCGDTANRITGNSGANTITAQGGRDTILIGGDEGVDVIDYGDVSESTGTSRDVVHGFDASGEDVIGSSMPALPDLALLTRSEGALRSGSFNADMAAALDGVLGAGGTVEAVLWNPTGGNLDQPGHRYLVVDLDNSGGYDAGLDLVIQFVDMRGTLDLSDFGLVA